HESAEILKRNPAGYFVFAPSRLNGIVVDRRNGDRPSPTIAMVAKRSPLLAEPILIELVFVLRAPVAPDGESLFAPIQPLYRAADLHKCIVGVAELFAEHFLVCRDCGKR